MNKSNEYKGKDIKTSTNIQQAYDEQYTTKTTQWRELGAKYKSQNIIDIIGHQSFQKVLDFGAGEGSILMYLDKNKRFEELFALEISESGIAQILKRKLNKLKGVKQFDGYTSDYADNEFDLVYCSHVMEHIEHPRLVLREIKRISKFQVFEIPLDYSKNVDTKAAHFLGYGHINIFTPSTFKFLLKSEGFDIINEIHTGIEREVLEFNWYENMQLKKTLKRKILSNLMVNKATIAKMLFGKAKANEFYHSAFTCFTNKSGELHIF